MAKEAEQLILGHLDRTDLDIEERIRLERALAGLRYKQSPRETQPTQVDLREQTYDLLTQVREPSTAEQKEFEGREFVFLPVGPKTLPQVIEEDPEYFCTGQLDYANAQPDLSDYAMPSAMLVAIKPTELFVPGSLNKNCPTQLALTQAHSSTQIEAINPAARSVVLPATGLAQLDKAYKAKTGNVLFTNRFVRALDKVSGVGSSRVGRPQLGLQLDVSGWNAYGDGSGVGAVLAVVFIRK